MDILNPHPEKLKVGMKVTTDYIPEESKIVRTILRIIPYKDCSSGLLVKADGGKKCPCCEKYEGTLINSKLGIDASWFLPVK
jgi:hypothetical protein